MISATPGSSHRPPPPLARLWLSRRQSLRSNRPHRRFCPHIETARRNNRPQRLLENRPPPIQSRNIRRGCASHPAFADTRAHPQNIGLISICSRAGPWPWLRRRRWLHPAAKRPPFRGRSNRCTFAGNSAALPAALARFRLDKVCRPCTSPGFPTHCAESHKAGAWGNNPSRYSFC